MRPQAVLTEYTERDTDALGQQTSCCFETKKPEPVQVQAQIVTGTAQQHVYLGNLGAFQ